MEQYPNAGEIIRLADSNDVSLTFTTIAASCSFDKTILNKDLAYNRLKNSLSKILSLFPQFRIRLVKKNNFYYWQYSKNNELIFENLVAITTEDESKPLENLEIEKNTLWRIHISETLNNRTQIKLICNHIFCDGRNIYDMLEIFLSFILNEPIPEKYLEYKKSKDFPILGSSFGKIDWFINEKEIRRQQPDSWKNIHNKKIFPDVKLPSYSIHTHWSFEYSKIKPFIIKHKVSIQGIVSCIALRAIFKYNKDLDQLCQLVPIDTRFLSNSTENHQTYYFFPNNSFIILVFDRKDNNILEDIKRCNKILKDQVNSNEAAQQTLYIANLINEKTLEAKPFQDIFYSGDHNIISASHLGKVCEKREDVKFWINNPVSEYKYWPSLYALHTNKKLIFSWCHPYNIEKEFFDIMEKTIKEVIDYINKDE